MSSLHKVTCFECGSDNLQVIDEKNTVCLNCGIIQNKEEKIFKNDSKNKNTKGSIKGSPLIPVTDSTEKRYSTAFRQILCICEKMNLQEDICVKSAEILIDLAKHRTLKRHSLSLLSIASVYSACRASGKGFNLKQASDFGYTSKQIKHEYCFVIKTLNIKPGKIELSEVLKMSKNRVDPKIIEKIMESYKKSKRAGGKSPRSLVAAASYIAAQITGGSVSQREASNSFDVTERALRTSYKDMVRELAFNIQL